MKKVLLSILLLLPMTLSAQAFYDYTPNARVAAMGGAAIATCADAFAVFGNAASTLMEYKAVQASFSYADFAGEYRKHRMLSGGAYARFAQRHALVVGAQINIEPKNSSGYRPASQLFDLAYGYKLSDRLSLAATARYRRNDTVLTDSANVGFGADLSLFSRLPLGFLEGSSVSVGGKLSFDTPTSVAYGRYSFAPSVGASLALPFSDSHLLDIAADIKYGFAPADGLFVARLGAEYSLMRLFYFRAGGNLARISNTNTVSYGTIGCGVRFFHLQFDIAYIMGKKDTPLDNAVQVNFGLDF